MGHETLDSAVSGSMALLAVSRGDLAISGHGLSSHDRDQRG